jgi:hypothetical protein
VQWKKNNSWLTFTILLLRPKRKRIEKILVFQTIEQNEPQDNSCGSVFLFGKYSKLDNIPF